MADLLRLVRVNNLVIAGLGVLAGGWIALGHLAVPAPLGWAAISGVGLGMAGNVLNDIWDEPGDRANTRADRPLASGRVRRGIADLLVWWGACLGLAGAALVSGTLFALAFVSLAVMTAYSPVLKRRGLAGNFTVAAVAGFPLMFGALAVHHAAAGVVPWILAAWLHFGREVAKDLVDVPGDRVLGRRTLPILSGERVARDVARVILWSFIPVSILLPALAGYGWGYFVLAAAADGLVWSAARSLARERYAAAVTHAKLAMPLGVAALVLGRVV
ncbi:MAG TPA: geranylgeranylglycerol-phosphate geranylgeranyltransferase [Gemmatimonadales bacterium]|nr:geranylgeranylglycerol-phosphate geranylgeranyltransferase [Gemmatimonadales bacterium]